MKVEVEAVADALGYQCQFTNGSDASDVATAESSTIAVTKGGLSEGATYYVQARPFAAYSDGQRVYGGWSGAKSVYVEKSAYTVAFDSAGGTAVASQEVARGEAASEPIPPTREGYAFEGWRLDGEPYGFGVPVTADLSLRAAWAQRQASPAAPGPGSPSAQDGADGQQGSPSQGGADAQQGAPAQDGGAREPMYRLYNPYSGEHFYTADASERDFVASAGWVDEGVGWTAPLAGDPVYRLYNPYAGEHHYTLSADERDGLVAAGWTDEGVGWYSDPDGAVPLYREYNPNEPACNHNYTTSREEHDGLVSLGWRDEGIAWYGV